MESKVKTRTLVGGTNNGRTVQVESCVKVFYIPVRSLTYEEAQALKITETIQWRWPDEVYELHSDGKFHYVRTVEYSPK